IPGLRVTGVHHGYFSEAENEAVLSMIAERAPDLLLVGLGAPKQELWIHRHRDRLRARVAMGAGGALDAYAGRVRRAPRLWQKLGLEWAYRLVQQPRRFRRTLVLPRFAWAVLRRRLYRSIPGEGRRAARPVRALWCVRLRWVRLRGGRATARVRQGFERVVSCGTRRSGRGGSHETGEAGGDRLHRCHCGVGAGPPCGRPVSRPQQGPRPP